jgi:type IV secretion system protein VirB11
VNLSDAEAKRVILAVASSVAELCGEENRVVSAELPGTGSRFQGILPPLAKASVFAIRKKAIRIFSLRELTA